GGDERIYLFCKFFCFLVCLLDRGHIILNAHSDFHFHIYLVFWCSTDHFASTVTRKEQFARHEILRRQGGLRAPPQDDIVSFEGGCRPLHPCFASANIAFY
ncbi:MAG: hypothetical protein IKK01_05990, partial [Clostridia bacterium]|nr:hypothetical protein [Clostridia bacterium]